MVLRIWKTLVPGEPIDYRNIFRLICHPANLKDIRNIRELETVVLKSGHILDLYCVRLSDAVPFSENYAKLYFNAKNLEKGLNRGVGEIFGAFFSKKCSFS